MKRNILKIWNFILSLVGLIEEIFLTIWKSPDKNILFLSLLSVIWAGPIFSWLLYLSDSPTNISLLMNKVSLGITLTFLVGFSIFILCYILDPNFIKGCIRKSILYPPFIWWKLLSTKLGKYWVETVNSLWKLGLDWLLIGARTLYCSLILWGVLIYQIRWFTEFSQIFETIYHTWILLVIIAAIGSISLYTWIKWIYQFIRNSWLIAFILSILAISYQLGISQYPDLGLNFEIIIESFMISVVVCILISLTRSVYRQAGTEKISSDKRGANFEFEHYWNIAIGKWRDKKEFSEVLGYISDTSRNFRDIPYLIEEPIYTDKDDDLWVKKNVEIIFDKIYRSEKLPERTSFNIGIEWDRGCGKTSLINLLKAKLDTVPGTTVYMDFNVWRHRGDLAQSFLSEFMIFLRQKKILSSSTTDNIEKYAQQISNAHYSISLITSFLSLFHTEKTAQERYDEIADQIKISNIRIVVFLDDLDRLDNWSKWNEVFALLRAWASFSNVIFVVAYSKEQILQMWEKEKGAKSEELLKQEVDNYLEKIFNSSTQLDYSLETLDNERANKEWAQSDIQKYFSDYLLSEILPGFTEEVLKIWTIKEHFAKNKQEALDMQLLNREGWEDNQEEKIQACFKDLTLDKALKSYFSYWIYIPFRQIFTVKFTKDISLALRNNSNSSYQIDTTEYLERTPRKVKFIINSIVWYLWNHQNEVIVDFLDTIKNGYWSHAWIDNKWSFNFWGSWLPTAIKKEIGTLE